MVLVALGLLILVVSGCGLTGGTGLGGTAGSAEPAPGADSRKPAPELSGTTLDGLELSKAAFAGRPLVLAFWGSR
jgi:hypothetical protein